MPSSKQIICFVEGSSSPNAVISHMPTGSEVQSVQLAYIKQSNCKDGSKSFDDTVVFIIENAQSPILDIVMASDFAITSSHSLKGTDIVDIIKL